jgi:hypothetical protein
MNEEKEKKNGRKKITVLSALDQNIGKKECHFGNKLFKFVQFESTRF